MTTSTLAEGLAVLLRSLGVARAFRLVAAHRRLVTIVCLHRVSPTVNAYFPPLYPEAFRELCRFLKRHYEVVLLRDLERAGANGRKPLVVLSFDDGYHDFIEHAAPVMLSEGLRANQNVITGCLDSGRTYVWQRCLDYLAATQDPVEALSVLGAPFSLEKGPEAVGIHLSRWILHRSRVELAALDARLDAIERREAHPVTASLTWNDLRELDRLGFEIGSHTVTHAALDLLDEKLLGWELIHSKARLESEMGRPVDVLAFPAGRYSARVVDASLRVGYTKLLGLDDRLSPRGAALWQRVMVYGRSPSRMEVQSIGLEGAVRRLRSAVNGWSLQTETSERPDHGTPAVERNGA